MKKVLLIGWKDLTLAFRDMAALVLMLAAPFALTVGLGFVTGRLSGTSATGVSQIPVVIVNEDTAELGQAMVDLFESKELADLVDISVLEELSVAQQQVDDDLAAVAIRVPPGFSRSIMAAPGSTQGETVQIELYTNPTRPTSVGIIKTIVDGFVNQVEVGRVAGQVTITQLLRQGLIAIQDAAAIGAEVGAHQAEAATASSSISVKNVTRGGRAVEFDVLAYLAPGMALMFLMFTVSNGGRTLLTERAQGTLHRLLVSPTSTSQVLGGKVFGIFITGVAQMLILILASTLLFGLEWGDPLGVLVLVLASVVGAVGWGMIITALAKTPGQVNAIGSAIMLTFGIMGGSFFDLEQMPSWFRTVSKITPNAWGLDGFNILAFGGQLSDLLSPIVALMAMGAVLFTLGVWIMNRRGITEQ